jgi:drug/metabolite transporter (DMT)-like permease
MLIGLGGVVALVGIDLGGSSAALIGAAAILGATLGYAIGPLIAKRRFSEFKPLGPVTAAMGAASVMLLPFGIADFPAETPPADALASVLVLGLVCSALAFILFFSLLAEIGPARASVITYINPVVALGLGVAILGEQLTAGAAVGLLLILAGSWLSTDGRLPPGLAAMARGRRPRPAAT